MTGRSYIGITRQRLSRRWAAHLRNAASNQTRYQSALYGAIRKYGAEHFSIEAIVSAITIADLGSLEISLITQENTRAPDGYNLSAGGAGLLNPTPETRARMRIAQLGKKQSPELIKKRTQGQIGRKRDPASSEKTAAKQRGRKRGPRSAEANEKTSAAMKGHIPTNLAKIHADQTGKKRGPQSPELIARRAIGISRGWARRRELGLKRKGVPLSERTKAKIARSNTGKRHSIETREKISAAQLGIKRPQK